jgi:uncharacterized alpha/beta hydrolase family protein
MGEWSNEIFSKKRQLIMIVVMTNILYKIGFAIYRFQKQIALNGMYRFLPKENWKNRYPIVLVHGMAGSGQDQSYLMGNYF